MIMFIQNLVKYCLFILKILSKNQILTSIKGHKFHNSVAYIIMHYCNNLDVDLVDDNVYTKFCLNLTVRSQDIKQKPNCARITE